jgi:hypothetical protein
LDNLERDWLPFGQGFKAVTLDGGKVDKNVFAVVLLDKPEPLAVIEPFHCTVGHYCGLLVLCVDVPRIYPGNSAYTINNRQFLSTLILLFLQNSGALAASATVIWEYLGVHYERLAS